MEALVCPFCSGIVEVVGESGFGKCKYCKRTFSEKNAVDMASASDGDRENVVKWRNELMNNLHIVEQSQKRRDYSNVKYFAMQILSVIPGDFSSRYFAALSDYKSGNDSPYTEFLKSCDISRASSEELELVSGKIIDYAEKKHEADIKAFFVKVYGSNSSLYIMRAEKAIADYIAHLRLTGIRDCDVFICHSSVDADEAKKLVSGLERSGLTCWLSERNLLPGTQDYEEELRSAVEHCRMMLFLSSANSIYSKECEKELRIANAEGKLFFAVKLDNEPYYGTSRNILSDVQWLNAFDGVTVHGDEIAAAVNMVFADDEKEKAELERRALEARKRAEENAKIKANENTVVMPVVTSSAVNNAEVFLVQIKECTKNYTEYSKDENKAISLIDRGLELNPDNSELWYQKFLVDVYNKYKSEKSIPKNSFTKELEQQFKEAAQETWKEKVELYCDDMQEIKFEYIRSEVFSELMNDADLSYEAFMEKARLICKWNKESLSNYIICEIASKVPEVFENAYFKLAEQKAVGKQADFIKSVKERAAKSGAAIRQALVDDYSDYIKEENDGLITRQKHILDHIDYHYEREVSFQYDKQIKDLSAERDMYIDRLNNPEKDEDRLQNEAFEYLTKQNTSLTRDRNNAQATMKSKKTLLAETRIKNILSFVIDPLMLLIKLVLFVLVYVSVLVIWSPMPTIIFVWVPLLIFSSDKVCNFYKNAPKRIWGSWGFIKISSTREYKKDIKILKQKIEKIKGEMRSNELYYMEQYEKIPTLRDKRENEYREEIERIESSLSEVEAFKAEIPDILSRVAHNKNELEAFFMKTVLVATMES